MLADDLTAFVRKHKDGVYKRSRSSSAAGHAVVLIGYNNTGGYWVVKNSFGASWGNGGFFKVGHKQLLSAHTSNASGAAVLSTLLINSCLPASAWQMRVCATCNSAIVQFCKGVHSTFHSEAPAKAAAVAASASASTLLSMPCTALL
jgi:hypothetical protein